VIKIDYDGMVKLIKDNDIAKIKEAYHTFGKKVLDENHAAYNTCQHGNLETLKYLISKGCHPTIQDAEWASKGKNEQQKEIFRYLIINYRHLEFERRDLNSVKGAFRKQEPDTAYRLLKLVYDRLDNQGELNMLISNYPNIIEQAFLFNNDKCLQVAFDFLISNEKLFNGFKAMYGHSDNDYKLISRSIITAITEGIKKRSIECLILTARYCDLPSGLDFSKIVRKSYKAERLTELFNAIPIELRHSLLKSLVSVGKYALALSLFESIPPEKLPNDPDALSEFLSPVIRAHRTDPYTFLTKSNIPKGWSDTLPIIVGR
jgi:hypothetical protein